MFALLGRSAVRWRWFVIAAWVVLVAVALPFLPRVGEPLKVGGFSSPATEAAAARTVLQEDLGFAPSQMLVIFRSAEIPADSPAFLGQVRATLAGVASLPNVTEVVLPGDNPSAVSPDNDTAYALVGLDLPPEEAQRLVPAFEAALGDPGELEMLVAGAPAFYRDIEEVSQRDLRRAEFIAFPFALAALLFVFRSVVAAAVPLVIGGAGVGAVLLTLFAVAQRVDVSIFALNLATMLGLGLAVDYSLFVTSRYREELAWTPGDVAGAVERTAATAGKAVFFSGLTVLIGRFGLVFFDILFLRSVGVAGAIVVLWSTLAALTLLPAVLAVIGDRIDRFAIRRIAADDHTDGFWAGLARWVMAHPSRTLAPTLALLVLLGTPFLHANISSPDATIIPSELPSRRAFDVLVEEYGAGEISPFLVVARSPSTVTSEENLAALHDLSQRLAADPRIARVQSITPPALERNQAVAFVRLQQGLDRFGIDPGFGRLATDDAAVVLAYSRFLPNDERNKELLREIRDDSTGGDLELLVDGGTAEIVDVVQAIYDQFPAVAATIVGATYLVLLLLFRSLLLPLKAIAMNTLSIFASYGALVWIFQDGNLSGLLGFDPQGFVEASLPVIMFCVLFGLSMDYEVFLLSRIREEWERTHDNTRAVTVGMQRSGRIITSAALLVVVVTASFVSADVVLIKALGFGIALAVLLDATIIRALVVPATMRLLGEWNWWLPGPLLRRLPRRSFAEESA
ncbi:MAG TPA: MMPL family transporter [Thermomicrobiales bacterium]|nr:MMPL family transporter [Thermomicrobiales bacterium]